MQSSNVFALTVVFGLLMGALFSALLSTPPSTTFCSPPGPLLARGGWWSGRDMLDAAGLTYDVDYTRCGYVSTMSKFMSVVPSEAERVKQLLEAAAPEAGNYYNFRVPITASAELGNSWADVH